jgi:integrase
MILFGLYTGQRLGDIARLSWGHIDLSRNELRLTTAKTGKPIVLPLAALLRTHIDRLPTPASLQEPLHPQAAAIPNICTLSSRFANLLFRAGLRKKRAPVKGHRDGDRRQLGELTFHSLRHSTVSMLHAAGLPQSVVQAYVGHSSAKISALYTHVGPDALAQAARALPELI